MILRSAALKAKGLLPADQVIGASTDGTTTQAPRAVELDPRTFARDDAGVTVIPGHLFRALRRVAKIDGAEALRRFPLTVDRDLALG